MNTVFVGFLVVFGEDLVAITSNRNISFSDLSRLDLASEIMDGLNNSRGVECISGQEYILPDGCRFDEDESFDVCVVTRNGMVFVCSEEGGWVETELSDWLEGRGFSIDDSEWPPIMALAREFEKTFSDVEAPTFVG